MRVRLPLLLSSLLALMIFSVDATPVSAQSPEDDVRATIDKLFDGMRAGDSTMVRSVFHPSVSMATTFTHRETGDPTMRDGSADDFVTAVGTPHDQVWNERIWDVTIHVRDNLASAWMNYAFYQGSEFSHCGVNSFQFFRSAEGWKVIYLVDTRQRQGCELPEWD